MRKVFLLVGVISIFTLRLFAQNNNSNIITSLKSFISQQKPEKAYLQFDKPYYDAGDTLYFKAYITGSETHQLSDLSGILHVDLINRQNKIEQSIQLQLTGGTCHGDFSLPDSLSGVYRVRAYTQWMRNRGQTDFFERLISINPLNKNHTAAGTAIQTNMMHGNDLQFFPEGGNLVTGIRTKVGFKAIGANGLAVETKGVIFDNDNKEVCTFSSTHLGMGDFFLTPFEKATYTAKITFADGSQSTVDLPKPLPLGISLIIDNDSTEKTFITIASNAAYFKLNQNKNFLLVIYSGEKVINAPFTLEDPIISLNVSKEQLHEGVATVTLFSAAGEALCERLIFVKNIDQLHVRISTDKNVYGKREKVTMLVNTKTGSDSIATGNFSVSVIDESMLPANEMFERNIFTDLLLTSYLKGYVEQPNYYFNDTSKDALTNLDILMLTQGYRNFQWKKVLDTNRLTLAYQPEKGLDINGFVTDQKGNPLSNSRVTLIPSGQGPLLVSTSDLNGAFHFSNLSFTDTMSFILNAANAARKNFTKITYVPGINEPPVSAYRSESSQLFIGNIMNSINNGKKYPFDTDTIRDAIVLKKVTITNTYRTQSLMGAGNADQVMHADEINKVQGGLTTRLTGRLRGVGFSNGSPYLQVPTLRGQFITTDNSPMLVIVDGVEANPNGALFDVDQIDASQVQTVEVLKYTGTSIYGVEGANGVLIITTDQEKESSKNLASIGVLPIRVVGFYEARTFYSPKYDYNNINSNRADLRSAIYWNPEVRPDRTGNTSFDYFNADGSGTYKVIVEGIDGDGNLGRAVYRYQVK